MKCLILIGWLLASAAAQAEWVKYGESESGNSFYLDPTTIRIEGNVRRVWGVTDLKQRGKLGEMSYRTQDEFDCKGKKHHALSMSIHSEPILRGAVLLSSPLDDIWRDTPPNSTTEMLLKIVCGIILRPSLAAADAPMRFSTFWPCSGNASFCGIRILAQGVIQLDTAQKLAQFLSDKMRHEHELSERPTIVFDSLGGSLVGAIELGRVIRKNRMDTEIASSYSKVRSGNIFEEDTLVQSPVCASACSIAFSGGLNRSVQAGSRLGIHQFRAEFGTIGDSGTQLVVVALASYLEEMGVRRTILDRASLVPPSSMLWLSNSEATVYRLDNTSPERAPWRVVATPRGEPVLEVVQTVSQGRDVLIQLASAQGEIRLNVTTILAKSAYHPDRVAHFPVSEPAQISICGDKSCFKARSLQPWVRTETESHVRFQAIASLRQSELRSLSASTVLSVKDNFGTATSDVSLATTLSESGFSNGVNLLLRLRK